MPRFTVMVLWLWLLPACQTHTVGPDPDAEATLDVSLDQPFFLAVGDRATIASTGLAITFREVLEDYRCPRDVVCVWAGNATIEVMVRASDMDRAVRLHTAHGPDTPAYEDAHGFRVRLLLLAPDPPPEGGVADPIRYTATLRVERP